MLGMDIIGPIFTISSILFGFMAGFTISKLWTRFTEVREAQNMRSATAINIINYSEFFYHNKEFKKKFIERFDDLAMVDNMIGWDNGHVEHIYAKQIEETFTMLEKDINNQERSVYMTRILAEYSDFIESNTKIDTLGKERLFFSEWLMLILLSIIIMISTLVLYIPNSFVNLLLPVFSSAIVLVLYLIYNLDILEVDRDLVSVEPNQRIFDELGKPRFYMKSQEKYIPDYVKEYRNEEDVPKDLRHLLKD